MTKTDTALPGPVHRPSVPRCQLKKVTRRSSRLSRCCANVSEDDASIRLTAIHCEALPASSRPSAAAFASTQQPQQNVHQAMLVSSSEHTPQNSSNESVVPVAGGRTKEYCDWWCEQVLEQSDLSLFNVRLIGDAGSPQLFTSMARNDLAYCRCACAWIALCSCPQQHTSSIIRTKTGRMLQQFFCSKWGHNRVWNIRQLQCPCSWYCRCSPNQKLWSKLLPAYSAVRSACQCPMWKLFLCLPMLWG